jgi:glucuronoarabinoxylan endo-1,4-beta-xylanase
LRVAALIHDDLVSGNVSAWHYWWLMPGSDDNSALVMKSTQMLATRAWVLGNWSRFVRPGFMRVALTAEPQNSIYLSAFKNPDDGRVVVVAVNQGYGDTTQDFTIGGGAIAELTPWVTSASQKLAQQAPVAVADGALSVTLPPRSVTSFVGTFTP